MDHHQPPPVTDPPSPPSFLSSKKDNKHEHKISPEKTRKVCAFIKNLCKVLKLRSITMCSALVFYHRFHDHNTQGGIYQDEYEIGATCVFLACKVEENIQHLDKILDVAYSIRTGQKTPLSIENKEKFWKIREKTLLCERILLDTMCFNITVDHAHSHALKFIRILVSRTSLQTTKNEGENEQQTIVEEEERELKQAASNILNDSLSTNMCLKHNPALIGVSAVLLAARFLKMKSPDQSRLFYENMEAMEKTGIIYGFDIEELMAIEDELVSTYEASAPNSSASPSKSESSKRVRVSASE